MTGCTSTTAGARCSGRRTAIPKWSGGRFGECGVTLAGPDPQSLVDEVPAEALRNRMRRDLVTLLPELATWISLDLAWGQRYAVTTLCRMLYTLDTARVRSRKAALLWGASTLDPQWSGLIRQVLGDRERGFDPDDAARPGSVEQTIAAQ